ncbi:MAG: alpha/beta fold hydrolase [Piscinibacter sp.]|uniref:alpha/beta hydrolase n=1 Tax=Piscinibacter sp. TaxID=1903157 RepID=UPI00258EEF64|nr:alpha/beta fold hydrolase [Piscinibacter sp.]MCW5665568.1 alpha/beta fold hydrolase [Piscinibacter sp.]
MNAQTERQLIAGPAGALECAIDRPTAAPVGLAVICHPHPQHGGTLDNKVAQTLARAALALGWRSVRFNFRGVGASQGGWDEGRGEIDDALAVIAAHRAPGEALLLAGFSFGGFVAASAAARLPEGEKPQRLALVGPSTQKQQVPPVPADTVVIHGEADDVVPLSATLEWARPQSLPVIVFPGTGHFFHGQLGLLKNTLVRQLQMAAA